MSSELKIPEVGEFVKNTGTLVKIEDVIPIPPPFPKTERDYIFEDIEARCELVYRDEILKSLGTYNDFYGIETSVKTAIKEMKEYAFGRQITKDSDLEVRIKRVVSQVRMKAVNRGNIYAKGFIDFEYKACGSRLNLPEPVETIVWSSKW